ncbi:aminoglycoside phosphotransferase [Chromatiales bacterium (ex Bugula neritina AB1)]|nr:aminoglycoside phosphotransferase [Chromatiales bacterium (ex Bugula neritina AB1)]
MTDAIHQLDHLKLAHYLETELPGFKGPLQADKFTGGQSNPTYKITASSGVYVLRKQPPGVLLKSAHAVDREFRVMKALSQTNVPVPEMHHLCLDTGIIGSLFFIMEYKPGRTFWDCAVPEVGKSERSQIYDEINRVLSELHSVDIDQVGLSDFGRPGNYYARQLKRWTQQYRASQFEEDIAEMEWLIPWLQENLPEDDGRVTLVHGDYRLDNLRYESHEPRCAAVLDWELSTLGHPFSDLANHCMQQRMPSRVANMSGLAEANLAELGIPTEEEFIEKYCERTGIAQIDNWAFYLSFSLFRLAAILQGVAKRGRDGNASSAMAKNIHKHVAPLAVMSKDIAVNGP